jgi:hypothetical protein
MKNYILFLFATFPDLEELEFFCLEHFPQISVGGLKYVIESNGNCIIIFDSDKEKDDLVESLNDILSLEHIRFYIIFEKSAIFWAELPEDLNNFIFKPISTDPNTFKTNTKKPLNNEKTELKLNDVLEKIQNEGIESLLPEEKKFLDDFEN